ncbi:MAG: polyprenyl synthetase family protein [Actinomycetota bacterium]
MAARTNEHLPTLNERFDEALRGYLSERRVDLSAIHPGPVALVDEIERLLFAGGRRLRPAFAYWGYRAGGGADGEAIVRAAASLELLHTMALIHDDLLDGSDMRRGAPSLHRAIAEESSGEPDPRAFGEAVALLCGDLSAVLADHMLMTSAFAPSVLVDALARSHRMRLEMAAGQHLGATGAPADPELVASLKGGSYTVEGPLLVGAALAGADVEVRTCLQGFGRPLGVAFQLLDDLRDGDAAPGIEREHADALVETALAALDRDLLPDDAVDALAGLTALVVQS